MCSEVRISCRNSISIYRNSFNKNEKECNKNKVLHIATCRKLSIVTQANGESFMESRGQFQILYNLISKNYNNKINTQLVWQQQSGKVTVTSLSMLKPHYKSNSNIINILGKSINNVVHVCGNLWGVTTIKKLDFTEDLL